MRDKLAPPDFCDPVIEAYKKDVDRTLLRENLKLTVDERFRKFESFARFARELRDTGQSCRNMIAPEDLVGEEWAEWYGLTPQERWRESEKLWQTYLLLGGSLDPEPDTQSPFFDPSAPRSRTADGRAGVRVLRRSRV